MLRRACGTAVSLLIVLVSYAAYALVVVPWIEPPAKAHDDSQIDAQWLPMTPRRQEELARIFPAGSWQLDSPTIIESNYGTLIFKENTRTEGNMVIKPCTLIVYASQAGSRDSADAARRAYVLDAPDGAMLEYEGHLSLNQAKGSRISSGRLLGQVSISSAATSPTANDGIEILARNIQIDRQRIWTPHEVKFRIGPHYGSGQDLIITLARVNNPDRIDQGPDVFNTIDSMELIQVDSVHLALTRQLTGQAPRPSPEASIAPDSPPVVPTTIPVEVRCQGPLRLDLRKQVVSLEKHVDVLVRNPGGPIDQLTCQRLDLRFNPTRPQEKSQGINKTSSTVDAPSIEPIELAAIGNPVILRTPSMGAIARAQRILLNIPQRRVLLEDSNQALIVQDRHQLVAPHIEYQFPPAGRLLGQFIATGPGRYEGKSDASQRPEFIASWQQECRLIRQQDQHVFSLIGQAQVSQAQHGTVQADDLHAWLHELPTPPEQAKNRTPGLARIRPRKMVLRGKVQIDTHQLSATTKLVEAWFTDPVTKPSSTPTTSPPTGPGTQPLLDLSGTTSRNKLIVQGNHVQLQVALPNPQPTITHMSVEGNVQVEQLASPAAGQDTFQLHARLLRMKQYATGLFDISLEGEQQQDAPADIQSGPVRLIGMNIHLDQQANRMQVQGPGEMQLLPRQTNQQSPGNTTRIRWKKQLDFDGQTVILEEDVNTVIESRMATGNTVVTRINGAMLQTTFDRPLDLRRPDRSQPIQLGRLTYGGKVDITSQTHSAAGEPLAVDQLHVHSLTLDMAANAQKGDLKATGPGWGSSVRLNPRRQQTQVGSRNSASPLLPDSDSKLIYVRVQFENGITGNILKRYIRFYRRVQTLYGPVPDWNSTLHSENLGEQGIELTSDQLQIADLQYRNQPSLVMQAVGGTRIDTKNYSALAHRLSYAQSNSLLTLDGDRDHAELVIKPRRQTPDVIAGKIMYWLDTNQLQVERAIRVDLGRFPTRRP